ncbi:MULTISPECIES: hypothetical protein [unclassified Pantoea]|uniref:hypothetical protein n=1 Tax=unclassified Pantoea TaxID=2630326 RepID=UPI0025552237|nr:MULTISPECIES: hypothetical protein [unclassified Pantoea]
MATLKKTGCNRQKAKRQVQAIRNPHAVLSGRFSAAFETECSGAEKCAFGHRLITAAFAGSQSEICARARF